MAKEKYLAAHRAFRSSMLLFAATAVSVLQTMPQTLSVDQYRGLKKGVDDLTRLDAELAEYEAEATGEKAEGDAGADVVEMSGSAAGGKTGQAGDAGDDASSSRQRTTSPRTRSTSDAAAPKAEDSEVVPAVEAGADPQAALNV